MKKENTPKEPVKDVNKKHFQQVAKKFKKPHKVQKLTFDSPFEEMKWFTFK